MRSTFVTLFAALAAAAPVEQRQSGPTDVQILNYALTLEHLENAFYKKGTSMFNAEDYKKAGLDEFFPSNIMEISKDEMTHVQFLSGALGAAATQPCVYNFPFTDVQGFLAIANVLEGVGVSAYLGAAKYIMNPDYLTAAGSILTVESRHSAYLRENQSPALSPFPSPFDIPLDFDQVYSLASQFIVSCPASNPKLPVMAFPALTVTAPMGEVKPGDKLTLKAAMDVDAKGAYFITSTGAVPATLTGSGMEYTVCVPEGVQMGQEYLVLTKDMNMPTDDNTVAGPAVVQVADNLFGLDKEQGWGKDGHYWGGKEDHWGGKEEHHWGGKGKDGKWGHH